MIIPVLNLAEGIVAMIAVGTGFTYHLGWKHGWNEGFRTASRIESTENNEEHQPAARNLVSFLYALGWHHGWDYGFRKGSLARNAKARKQRSD